MLFANDLLCVCVCVCLCVSVCVCLVTQSCLTLCDLWTVAHQASLSIRILQAIILEWVVCPPPEELPNPGIKPGSPALQAEFLLSETPGKPLEWVPYPFSRGSSQPRNQTRASCIAELPGRPNDLLHAV